MADRVATCPFDPSHDKFVTTAHECHDWLVDCDGNFIEDRGCEQVTHEPDPDNEWTCATCGEVAVWRERLSLLEKLAAIAAKEDESATR